MGYQRPLQKALEKRLNEPRKFIQVIAGPRQVGKTTIAIALRDYYKDIAIYHSADDVSEYSASWVDRIWEALRIKMEIEKIPEVILILDELQKIADWSSAIKKHWDRDTRENRNIKLVILGSSRLLLMDGLSESLMGRFELNFASHWSYGEMAEAFGLTAQQYQWFGGYPGAAELIGEESRFKDYIRNAIIEPSLTKDILLTTKIDKPALLRQLFEIGASYSGQIMSYNKMLGQLQDAGNTTTLAKYLKLLDQAGLLLGLNKYSNRIVETKGSIPKFQVHNTALLSALGRQSFNEAILDRIKWGNIFESSVGAHLVSQVNKHPNARLFYWRENNTEIDYVVAYESTVIGIEAKSGDEGISQKVQEKFEKCFPGAKIILVGKNGLPYETFMSAELSELA